MNPLNLSVPESYVREILDSVVPGFVLLAGYLYVHPNRVAELLALQIDPVSRLVLAGVTMLVAGYLLRLLFSVPATIVVLIGYALGWTISQFSKPSNDPVLRILSIQFLSTRMPQVAPLLTSDKVDSTYTLFHRFIQANFTDELTSEAWSAVATVFATSGAVWLLYLFHPEFILKRFFLIPFFLSSFMAFLAGLGAASYRDQALAKKIFRDLDGRRG